MGPAHPPNAGEDTSSSVYACCLVDNRTARATPSGTSTNKGSILNLSTRIANAKDATSLRISDAFKNEKGAFDLPSIMIGVAVVAILTVGVLAAIFGVIPWAQDNAAKQDASAIVTAQGVYFAQVSTGERQATDSSRYATLDELIAADLLSEELTGSTDIYVNAGNTAGESTFEVAVKSDTGKAFVATNANPTPVEGTFPTAP